MKKIKNYLIVGGSSGIGLEITKLLASEGNKVFVLSRNKNQLELSDNIKFTACDVLAESDAFPSIDDHLNGIAYCPGSINLKPFKSF